MEQGQALGFTPPSPAETARARAIAIELMGHEVASAQTILALQRLQPASALVFREAGEVTGFVAILLLDAAAEADLLADRFDGLTPPETLLSRGDDAVGLYYVWGVAGATKEATSAIMQLLRHLRYDALAELATYALAVTPAGRRAGLTQLEYRPARHADDNLIVGEPTASRCAA